MSFLDSIRMCTLDELERQSTLEAAGTSIICTRYALSAVNKVPLTHGNNSYTVLMEVQRRRESRGVSLLPTRKLRESAVM